MSLASDVVVSEDGCRCLVCPLSLVGVSHSVCRRLVDESDKRRLMMGVIDSLAVFAEKAISGIVVDYLLVKCELTMVDTGQDSRRDRIVSHPFQTDRLTGVRFCFPLFSTFEELQRLDVGVVDVHDNPQHISEWRFMMGINGGCECVILSPIAGNFLFKCSSDDRLIYIDLLVDEHVKQLRVAKSNNAITTVHVVTSAYDSTPLYRGYRQNRKLAHLHPFVTINPSIPVTVFPLHQSDALPTIF